MSWLQAPHWTWRNSSRLVGGSCSIRLQLVHRSTISRAVADSTCACERLPLAGCTLCGGGLPPACRLRGLGRWKRLRSLAMRLRGGSRAAALLERLLHLRYRLHGLHGHSALDDRGRAARADLLDQLLHWHGRHGAHVRDA